MRAWSHRHWARLLPAYRLGQLPGPAHARVAAHLVRCEVCRADLAGQEALASLLRQHDPARPVPETAAEQVLGVLARESAPMAPPGRLRLALTPLAAICLFLGGMAAGGRFSARVETQQVVREVPVEKVVERVVERVVEKRVEVPVEKVVYKPVVRVETRWRERGPASTGGGGGAVKRPGAAAPAPTVRVPVGNSSAEPASRPSKVSF